MPLIFALTLPAVLATTAAAPLAGAGTGADPQSTTAQTSSAAVPTSADCSTAPTEPGEQRGGEAGSTDTDNLGPGSLTFPITADGMVDDTHYVVSRHMSLTPGVIAGYDTANDELTYSEEVVLDGEESEGTWGATVSGDDLYVGMSFGGERRSSILRVEHETGELTEVGSTAPAELIWAMDSAPDGAIYAATSRQDLAGLWEHDPETGETTQLEQFEQVSRQDARSVAATADTVYVGIGNAAPDLWAYDRASGDSTSILPEELSEASYVYTLDATEDMVVAGTSSPSTLTVIDPDSPDNYEIVDIDSGTVQSIEIVEDVVYFTGSSVLWSYDTTSGELTELGDVNVAGDQTRGLHHADGVLHGSNNMAHVWSYDLATEELETIDLVEAGVEASGEPAQSLTVDDGLVFTGGHVTLGVRELGGELEQVAVPGEPKSTVVRDGVLYMAMYSGGDLVTYDPESGEVDTVGESPPGHNRPRDLHHEPERDVLLMGNQADTDGGGSLVVHDPNTGETTANVPFDDRAVSAVTSSDGTPYIAGSSGMQDPDHDAVIAAWDLDAADTDWSLVPVEGASSITGLVAVGTRLVGLTDGGTLFVVDTEDREVIATQDGVDTGGLVEHNGTVYGASEDQLFRVDTDTAEFEVILDDLGGEWFTWPGLASDGCALYIMSDTDVLRVSSGPREKGPETDLDNQPAARTTAHP